MLTQNREFTRPPAPDQFKGYHKNSCGYLCFICLLCISSSSQYKSYEDDLNSAMTSLDTNVDSDMSLSEELANLLADNSEPPAKKQVVSQRLLFVLLLVLAV